ncbi:MAG: MOSC domain-containing protein [Candidatus Dormibacteria bacterium]
MTSIYKEPVAGPVAVRGINLEGDEQADRSVHGGPDKAVYAYALEDIDWWSSELQRSLGAGAFGENLTVTGVDVTDAIIGERWLLGDTVLEVAQPRQPCFKLGIRMGDQRFVKRFARAGRPGAYLRIITPGVVTAGDAVTVARRPRHGITIGRVSRALLGGEDPAGAARAPELPASVRQRLLRHEASPR